MIVNTMMPILNSGVMIQRYRNEVCDNGSSVQFYYFIKIYLFITMMMQGQQVGLIVPQENKQDNQQYIQQTVPQIQVISASESARKYAFPDNQDENQNEEIVDINTIDLVQGNPILPPGKHNIKEQPSFRLKFLNNRQKFNKTSFMPSLGALGNSLILTSRKMDLLDGKKAGNKNRSLDQDDQQEDIEYANLLKDKKEVYRRIKNSKLNKIGKDKVLCSIFFDGRKQKITAKTVPIYQHLAKIKNIRRVQVQRDWLQFQSSFQSGNLLMALNIPSQKIRTYELYMQNDVNTKGCTQWFYFKVVNYARGKTKFRIMNFYKPASLYQKGMKILCSHDGIQWKRTGTSIKYYKNEYHQGYYTLDFLYQFEANSTTTYFSYGYPYSYSLHLTHFLNNFTTEPRYQKIVTKGTLCMSAMNNPIPILYITNQSPKKQQKPIIYIIGRQHPGQTPSSYIMEGLISFLTSNALEAKELRDKYQFRIIPMVNVDGVISGNYRSNISGFDINRQWQFPSKKVLPEVFWLKQQVASNKKHVAFFLDIHAHSRKMNSFFYSSNKPNKQNKVYPFICSKLNKFISYGQSTFNDDPSKRSTARVILQSQFSIQISLTFQVSFYGYYDEIKQSNFSFKQSDLRNIGECLGIGLYYSMIGIENAKKQMEYKILPKHMNEKEKTLLKNSAKILQKWNKQLEKQNCILNEHEDVFSEGSSVDPEHFQLKQEEKRMLEEALEREMKQNQKLNKMTDFKEEKRKELNYISLESQESKLLKPKGEPSDGAPLGMSGTQFYEISSSKNKVQTNKNTIFSVRQLQLQLQGNGQGYPESRIRGLRLKMGQRNVNVLEGGNKRYGSLDLQLDGRKNYRNDVIEMKKALKFLLQSKTSNYEDYKSCFKTFNTQISYMNKNQIKIQKK